MLRAGISLNTYERHLTDFIDSVTDGGVKLPGRNVLATYLPYLRELTDNETKQILQVMCYAFVCLLTVYACSTLHYKPVHQLGLL